MVFEVVLSWLHQRSLKLQPHACDFQVTATSDPFACRGGQYVAVTCLVIGQPEIVMLPVMSTTSKKISLVATSSNMAAPTAHFNLNLLLLLALRRDSKKYSSTLLIQLYVIRFSV